MGNPEHLKILKQGVEAWNRWRKENPGIRPNLAADTIRALDLEGADLSAANLQGANLGSINLTNADLRAADLRKSGLRAANFSQANLNGAKLAGADLVLARLPEASLRFVDLREANLQHAWLPGADLESARGVKAHFGNATLKGAHAVSAKFTEADLMYSDCQEVNLQSADLRGASLKNANFTHGNLRNARLDRANFSMATLNEACLREVSLVGTNFLNAELAGADVREAIMSSTQLGGVDLSKTKNLDFVSHRGRSSIDTESLYRSRGKISEVFLRGVGISDILITYLPSLVAPSAFDFNSCFISYSHEDKNFAIRLHNQLQGRGIRCWLDEKEINPGDRILDVVDEAIRSHDKLFLCCSKASLKSWWVKDEIDKALERERQEDRDIIIPLNLDGYLLAGWESGRASTLRSRLAADFTGWQHDSRKFEEQFERVVKALRADDEAVKREQGAKL